MGFHFLVGAGLDRCRKCRAWSANAASRSGEDLHLLRAVSRDGTTKTWAVLEPHSLRAVSADAFIARAQAVCWGGEPE